MLEVSKLIQSLIVPVAMISACGLLCLALYNRLAAVVARLRGFHRERVHAIGQSAHVAPDDLSTQARITRESLDTLEAQVRGVTARARLLRNALISLMLCILFMLFCSIALGLALVVQAMNAVALSFFFLGVLCIVTGIILAVVELTRSLDPVVLEQGSIERLRDMV